MFKVLEKRLKIVSRQVKDMKKVQFELPEMKTTMVEVNIYTG